MKRDELIEIIQNGESSKIEFKTEDVHINSLAEEIVAFANLDGGIVLIGVDDSGEIKGCERKKFEEFVINVCRSNVRPAILPVIEKVVVDGKMVLAVIIERGDTPYSTNRGLYFIRVGSTKQTPTQQELLRLFQKRNILQFDETPVVGASVNSIDLTKVGIYLTRLGQSPLDEENDHALINDLINLSIMVDIDDGRPTVGGVLAFGKKPQRYFPSFNIMCGAYKGSDFLSDTIREKELFGTLDELIEDAIAFLKLSMPQAHAMERGVRRNDSYLYPVEALREGVVNAICHRDYTITGSAIRLFLFDDRLEIRSPGGLPNTLTLENMLFRQYIRNQVIASFLAGGGYMERRGKGMLRMLKSCEEINVSCEFSLTPDHGEFVITFRARGGGEGR